MNRPKLKQPIKQPRLLVTNGLKPPDLSEAVKVGAGDWAEVYFQPSSNKVIRAIYPADSTKEMLKRVTQSSYIQNHARKAKIAPRVYSVGMRSDGRIYTATLKRGGSQSDRDLLTRIGNLYGR